MIKVTSATPSISSFTWSASEQVWPFEKDAAGRTLYCKEISMGNMPNTGALSVSLGDIVADKIYQVDARFIHPTDHKYYSLTSGWAYQQSANTYTAALYFTGGNINIETWNAAWSTFPAYVKLIYAK